MSRKLNTAAVRDDWERFATEAPCTYMMRNAGLRIVDEVAPSTELHRYVVRKSTWRSERV